MLFPLNYDLQISEFGVEPTICRWQLPTTHLYLNENSGVINPLSPTGFPIKMTIREQFNTYEAIDLLMIGLFIITCFQQANQLITPFSLKKKPLPQKAFINKFFRAFMTTKSCSFLVLE